MTREECAIVVLRSILTTRDAMLENEHEPKIHIGKDDAEAIETAIAALSEEPCEDAISRAEAIKAMDDLEQEDIELYGCPIPEGFDGRRAIEALQKLPSVTPIIAECEDTISRQAVMDFIRGLTRWCVRSEDGKFNNVGLLYDDVMFGLDRLPSATPKQKMGRWITKIKSDLRGDVWPTNPKCSECGGEPYYHNTIYNYKFCPYCGAKMSENPTGSESED